MSFYFTNQHDAMDCGPSGTYIWKLKTETGKLKIENGKWIK